jgi:hypothetical protein
VLTALRARRVYATNGPRIVLQVALGGSAVGSVLDARLFADLEPEDHIVRVRVVAPEALERVDLVRSGEVVESVSCELSYACRLERPVEGVVPGEYLYVRAVQRDGGAAWSSPFFFR